MDEVKLAAEAAQFLARVEKGLAEVTPIAVVAIHIVSIRMKLGEMRDARPDSYGQPDFSVFWS